MRLVTWNVNSIRRRIDLLTQFIEAEQPDVICLQEIKCNDAQFPTDQLNAFGYQVAVHGAGGHGGVALASRLGLDDVAHGFGGNHVAPFNEPRLVSATVGDQRIATLYAPNGRQVRTPAWDFKLAWFELLRTELELELAEHPDLIVAGDFNVCPTEQDVYDPVKKRNRNLVSEPERAAFGRLLDLGFIDAGRALHPSESGFTWFAFTADQFEKRRGYRLDHCLAAGASANNVQTCRPLLEWRNPELGPSDHAPVVAQFRCVEDRR